MGAESRILKNLKEEKMKLIKIIIPIIAFAVFMNACTEEETSFAFEGISAPKEVTASFDITQDNTGIVRITPSGNGASSFQIYFGDTANETPTTITPGSTAEHTYTEGTFTTRIVAVGATGLTSEFSQVITIAFRTPENLAINATIDTTNPSMIKVAPTADFATLFDIYFGDVVDETPTTLMIGETLEHTYTTAGIYTLRMVAKGAGAATAEITEEITIIPPSDPVTLPIDFESFTIDYAFASFGNGEAQVVDNTNATGINTSSRVGHLVKPSNAEVWAGTLLELETPIDFSTKKAFKVKVYAPKSGIVVKLKVENATDAATSAEVDVTNSLANEWEELLFDFSTIDTSKEYHKVVLFFDFGNAGDDSVYLFDDIDLVAITPPNTNAGIQDFEGAAPTFTVFGNIADTQVVSNPDPTGENTSNTVAQVTKTANSEVWAGTFFETAMPLDLASSTQLQIQTWSPKSGIVIKAKIENQDATIDHEVDITNSVANSWETLTYDFSGAPPADYVRIVIFFDFGNAGDDSVYYFDTIDLVTTTSTDPPVVVQDFEGAAPTFTVFGNIADTQVIANPDASGSNTTGMVAQLTKTANSETWAGTFFEVPTPLAITTYNKISVQTWSPKSGIVVKVKIENQDATIDHEVDITNTVANGWETLTYDFSGAPAADYVRIVIFFDFGNNGDDSVYYFDEYQLLK